MEASTCRGCGADVAPGRTWCPPRVSPCLADFRRTVNYRERTLERDGYACAMCPSWWNRLVLRDVMTGQLRFAPWRKRRVAADHIDAIGGTGTHDPRNLQIACEGRPFRHHQRKTRVDVAKMRGNRLPITAARKIRWVLLAVAAYVAYRVGAPTLLGIDDLDVIADPAGAALTALPRVVLAAAVLGVLVLTVRVRRAQLQRLHHAVAEITKASETARRPIRVHRWGRVGWRIVPVDLTIRYPATFPDSAAAQRRKVEDAIVSKLGWSRRHGAAATYTSAWDTVRDRVRMRTPDPFVTTAPPRWPGLAAVEHSLWNPIVIAYDQAMHPVTIRLVERNLLIGGEPGAGKSNAMSALIAAAALDPTVQLAMIDLKKVEQAIWKPCASAGYADSYDDAVKVLDDLIAVMEQRYDFLMLDDKEKVESPDDGYELIALFVDELAALTMRGETKVRNAMAERLRLLVSLGRAAGIICVFATQKPTYDVVPTSIRDLIAFRWAMRCTTSSASDTILGDGYASGDGGGYNAARIHPEGKGVGYLLAEGGVPRMVRSYVMPTQVRQALAVRAANGRGVAPPRFGGTAVDEASAPVDA